MKLRNELVVRAPVEQAWDVMLDLERVAPCLPGAAIESSNGDRHTGTMTVKIGPITARYQGTVEIVEADARSRRAVMRAEAKDARGQGSAAATITSTMEAVPDGTRVRVETEMRITGPAAQFGRGVMQDVSAKLMTRFAEALADEISAGAAAAPAPSSAVAAGGARASSVLVLPPGPAGDSVGRGRPALPLAEAASRRPAPPERRTEDVLDLGEASREAVLKRALPAALAVASAVAVGWLVARRRRR